MKTVITRYEHGGGRVWLEDEKGKRDLVADLYADGKGTGERRDAILAAIISAGVIPPVSP